MTVMEAIRARRSIRAYKTTPVTGEQLSAFLEAVRLAPSWKDKQCWRVMVVTDRGTIEGLAPLLRNNPGEDVYKTAPCFVLFFADPALSGNRDEKPYYMTDIGIAMENAVLAAEELGLGTCWVGAFTEAPIKEYLGVPESLRLVALTPLGTPAESPSPRPRMALSDFVCHDHWGQPLDLDTFGSP